MTLYLLIVCFLDEDVRYFALVELHRLHDLLEVWQKHTGKVSESDKEWEGIYNRPPPLLRAWVCRQVQEHRKPVQLEGEEVDAVSSDDDENGELEEVPQVEDLAFLVALDNAIGEDD
jgi:hypothetical protein